MLSKMELPNLLAGRWRHDQGIEAQTSEGRRIAEISIHSKAVDHSSLSREDPTRSRQDSLSRDSHSSDRSSQQRQASSAAREGHSLGEKDYSQEAGAEDTLEGSQQQLGARKNGEAEDENVEDEGELDEEQPEPDVLEHGQDHSPRERARQLAQRKRYEVSMEQINSFIIDTAKHPNNQEPQADKQQKMAERIKAIVDSAAVRSDDDLDEPKELPKLKLTEELANRKSSDGTEAATKAAATAVARSSGTSIAALAQAAAKDIVEEHTEGDSFGPHIPASRQM